MQVNPTKEERLELLVESIILGCALGMMHTDKEPTNNHTTVLAHETTDSGLPNTGHDSLSAINNATLHAEDIQASLIAYNLERNDMIQLLTALQQETAKVESLCTSLVDGINGALKSILDYGNEIKPGFMQKVDDAIVHLYGMQPSEARAHSSKLSRFYEEMDSFISSGQQSEKSISEFAEYLGKTKEYIAEENAHMTRFLDEATAQFRQMKKAEADETCGLQRETSTITSAPAPYEPPSPAFAYDSPFIAAALCVLALKGARRALLPSTWDYGIADAVCWPFKAVYSVLFKR